MTGWEWVERKNGKKKEKWQRTECAGGESAEHFDAGLAVDHAVRDGCVFSAEVFFGCR